MNKDPYEDWEEADGKHYLVKFAFIKHDKKLTVEEEQTLEKMIKAQEDDLNLAKIIIDIKDAEDGREPE